jgi:hypothetical protein
MRLILVRAHGGHNAAVSDHFSEYDFTLREQAFDIPALCWLTSERDDRLAQLVDVALVILAKCLQLTPKALVCHPMSGSLVSLDSIEVDRDELVQQSNNLGLIHVDDRF